MKSVFSFIHKGMFVMGKDIVTGIDAFHNDNIIVK